MNHIDVKSIETPYGYNGNKWVIDEMSLPEYLHIWVSEIQDDYLKSIGSFMGLCPAWSKDIDWKGDIRFVWKLIDMDRVVLPLLLCEDDLDFSCIVIVVEVEKTKDFVYWNRIGYVLHENENYKEEMKNGILNTNSYSDEDWEKYGDNIALESVGSPIWEEWISSNWDEELYRRRINYTLPFYQTRGNVCWFKNTEWLFDKFEYEQMVNKYWEMEVINQLQNISKNSVLNMIDCAYMLADLTPDGSKVLEQHLKDFNEILLHVLAGDLVNEPLINLLKYRIDMERRIQLYCMAIEVMWKNGDAAVKNVVAVTVLERLSDEDLVWKRFGDYISDEFKRII